MNPNLWTEFRKLHSKGWKCVENASRQDWPVVINTRYPWVPLDVRDAMVELEEVISPDETCWLLTSCEYTGDSESSFAWNEWELQSIEAAGDDSGWIEQIKSFWNQHLPIALSVKDGYAYYALREDGTVVSGREPEFEEPILIAPTYGKFIALLADESDSSPAAPRG